jgi:hypothetical protein
MPARGRGLPVSCSCSSCGHAVVGLSRPDVALAVGPGAWATSPPEGLTAAEAILKGIVAGGKPPHQVPDKDVLERPTRLVRDVERTFPDVWKRVEQQVELFRTSATWPDWTLYPMNAVQLLVFLETHPDLWQVMSRSPAEGQALMARTIAGMTAKDQREQLTVSAYVAAGAHWRLGRGIYRFDPTLQESLLTTPLNGEIPVQLLFRLPEWALYIDLDAGLVVEGHRLLGFFTHLEFDITHQRPELRLLWLLETLPPTVNQAWLPSGFPLQVATIGEAREMVKISSQPLREDGVLSDEHVGQWATLVLTCLSFVIYLCSQGADISRRHHPEFRPARARLQPTKTGPRFVNPGGPAWWEVGYRVGTALRAAAPPQPSDEPPAPDRRGPAPHLRRAHWHLYWTGAGRQIPEVRWLHPILVGQRGDHELPPTVRRVRADDPAR